MRRSVRTSAIVFAAAVCGWGIRGVLSGASSQERPRETVHQTAHPAASTSDPETAVPRIASFDLPASSRGSRDLFSYREAPPPAPPIMQSLTAPAPPPRQSTEVDAAPPLRPRFDYRFIGTFGTHERRIAAFTRDGEVVIAKPGDRIGAGFVLRSIGVESVEVEPLGPETGGPQRIPLGHDT